MQKLDVESNPVGANCVRPHFEEITIKNQKGITLIALIITIIVMLILVGVTINVALNGGLFEKTETATRETEEKAILEEMLAMMEIDDNGKFDYETIIEKMDLKYDVEYTYPNATITGKLGEYKYIVSETEIKIGTKEIKAFEWKDVGLIVDTDTEYAISTGGIAIFSEEGKIRVVDNDGTEILVIDATDSSKIKNGKIDCEVIIDGIDTNIKIRMNEEDENDEKVYIEVQGMGTITCEKVKEKTYPIAYSYNGTVLIIEVSENEAVHRILGEVCRVEEVDDINKIEGYENDTVINEIAKEYSKVMVANSDHYVPAVYCEDDDKWYMVTRSGSDSYTQTISNSATASLDTTTSKEELEQMIQEARDSMNSN